MSPSLTLTHVLLHHQHSIQPQCGYFCLEEAKSGQDLMYVLQEMWALSCFMTGAPMTDVTTLFREAFFRYNSVNPLQPKACVRFATRSMMLLADYCRQHGLHAEAHSALTRAQAQVSDLNLAPQVLTWIAAFGNQVWLNVAVM